MEINQDFMKVMRVGKWVDKQLYRKQQESAWVVFGCIIGLVIIFLLGMAFGEFIQISF